MSFVDNSLSWSTLPSDEHQLSEVETRLFLGEHRRGCRPLESCVQGVSNVAGRRYGQIPSQVVAPRKVHTHGASNLVTTSTDRRYLFATPVGK